MPTPKFVKLQPSGPVGVAHWSSGDPEKPSTGKLALGSPKPFEIVHHWFKNKVGSDDAQVVRGGQGKSWLKVEAAEILGERR